MAESQEDMLKGRIAEAIVRCMFEELGFEVVPYGYENTCPTLANRDKLIQGHVKDLIRKTPDFIIVDKKRNATFIEVKYRENGEFEKDMAYPYDEAYIILLSKKYIGIEQYKNLDKKTKLISSIFNASTTQLENEFKRTFKSFKHISLFKELDCEIIKKYRNLLIKYMEKKK